MSVLVIGDVMTDVVVRPEGDIVHGSDRRAKIEMRPGGSAANQAAWLGYFGAKVRFVGRVGAPDVETESRELRRFGVETRLVGDHTRETGRLIAIVSPDGERSFLTDRGANLGLQTGDVPQNWIEEATHIQLSGYSFFASGPRSAALDVIARARLAGVSFGIDPASSGFLREIGAEMFLEWTRDAAISTPNLDEAQVLTGELDPERALAALAKHWPLVVLKLGAEGCLAHDGEKRLRARTKAPSPAVDATGAGDAFLAGFLAQRLRGEGLQSSLEAAVAAGGKATQIIGGRPPAEL